MPAVEYLPVVDSARDEYADSFSGVCLCCIMLGLIVITVEIGDAPQPQGHGGIGSVVAVFVRNIFSVCADGCPGRGGDSISRDKLYCHVCPCGIRRAAGSCGARKEFQGPGGIHTALTACGSDTAVYGKRTVIDIYPVSCSL